MKVGLQTTFDRPIINTRDESHSTDEYRRLHVIVGDANRMDVPQALKLGTTSMLLWLLEHADMAEIDLNEALEPLTLADPGGKPCTRIARPDPGRPTTIGKQVEPPPHGQMQVTLRGRYMRPRQRYTAPTHPESRHGPTAPPATSWRCGGRLSPTSPPYAMPTMTDD